MHLYKWSLSHQMTGTILSIAMICSKMGLVKNSVEIIECPGPIWMWSIGGPVVLSTRSALGYSFYQSSWHNCRIGIIPWFWRDKYLLYNLEFVLPQEYHLQTKEGSYRHNVLKLYNLNCCQTLSKNWNDLWMIIAKRFIIIIIYIYTHIYIERER